MPDRVVEIPAKLLADFIAAIGLDVAHIDRFEIHRGGFGSADLTVPFEDIAEPVVDAAGFEPDTAHVDSAMVEAVLGQGWRGRGDDDGTFYTGTVYLQVVQPPTRRRRR